MSNKISSGRTTSPQRKNRRGAYFKCETCGEEFYAMPSEIKKATARGSTLRYCSMGCYDKTGANNPFWGKSHSKEATAKMVAHPNRPRFTAENNPNFVRFGVEYGFKGSRSKWWRKYLLETIGRCEVCGFSDTRVLNLHHIDRDRSNNVRENLKLLCWNCHAIDHHEAKDGFYHFFNQDRPERRGGTKD